MVAADFTLYSNPVNRALYRPPPDEDKPPKPSDVKGDSPVVDQNPNGVQAEAETDEWIASDMTKYDSPLAELERQGRDRDARLTLTEAAAEGKEAQPDPATDP